MTRRLGWDVGGAHLKAALHDEGRIVGVWQEPSPLWLGLDHLETALTNILAQTGPVAAHRLTMTGELADIFPDRLAGVQQLTHCLERRLGPDLAIYAGEKGLVPPQRATEFAALVGSANWHASAALVASRLQQGLLVDMGSTTTDIVPVSGGQICNIGYTDAERLAAGELVYQGFTRTSLMAVALNVPFRGRAAPVMAEHFATMADAQRLIGNFDETDDQMPSADGRDKSQAASRARLARMLGHDADDATSEEWTAVAGAFAEAQLRRIHDAALQVLSRGDIAADAPLILAGSGRPLLRRLAARLDRGVVDFADLADCRATLREAASRAAPAVALAAIQT
ncbi:hydantoinase/oxoprolinase family protein [Aureimonas fodinaquatilis]|nr:hydantoinase/oxoprolinase family protein [Aureimonas fodinaquatilis]